MIFRTKSLGYDILASESKKGCNERVLQVRREPHPRRRSSRREPEYGEKVFVKKGSLRMAILANVKKIITDVVFPELVKNGEYSSFLEHSTGRFDYLAQALKELKGGKTICPWYGDATERTRLVICDKEYPEGLLEFDLKFLIEEVFSGTWYKDDAANTIMIVRKVDDALDFSWIRLRDFIQRMTERCMTLRHLKNDLQNRPQRNVTLYSEHPGELFLRDVGSPDRLLLNYDAFFLENRLRNFHYHRRHRKRRDKHRGPCVLQLQRPHECGDPGQRD